MLVLHRFQPRRISPKIHLRNQQQHQQSSSFIKMDPNTRPIWRPQLETTYTACKNYKHLYSGCGCIHEHLQALTVHFKRCVYADHSKMTENEYQVMHLDQPCKGPPFVIQIIFPKSCWTCSTGPQIITRSKNTISRAGYKLQAARKDEDSTPPRQKPIAQTPEPRSPAELERRIQVFESEQVRSEELVLRLTE